MAAITTIQHKRKTSDLNSGDLSLGEIGIRIDSGNEKLVFKTTDGVQEVIPGDRYSDADVDLHLNQDGNITDSYVLSWSNGDYAWVAQTGGSNYSDADVNTHLNQDGNIADGYVLSWDVNADGGNGDYVWVVQAANTDDQTAAEVNYTPTTPAHWYDPDPTLVSGALDSLANRINNIDGGDLEAP